MRCEAHDRVSPAEARRRILADDTASEYVRRWHELQSVNCRFLAPLLYRRRIRALRGLLHDVDPPAWGLDARVAWYGLVKGDKVDVWDALTVPNWATETNALRETVVRPLPELSGGDGAIISERDDYYGWTGYNEPPGGWGSGFAVPELRKGAKG